MLTIVLGYKSHSRRKEVPKVLYLGHDRKAADKAQKSKKAQAFLWTEQQHLPPGFRRRFKKGAAPEVKTEEASVPEDDGGVNSDSNHDEESAGEGVGAPSPDTPEPEPSGEDSGELEGMAGAVAKKAAQKAKPDAGK